MPDMNCAQNNEEVDEPWLRKLRGDANLLRYGSTVEIAVVNKNVAEYVRHWEGRAIEAEEKVERLEKELKMWAAKVEGKLRVALKKIESVEEIPEIRGNN